MKNLFYGMLLSAALICSGIAAENAPNVQADKTTYDFGNVSGLENVSGKFKFTNTGTDVLKFEEPKPSCGCTVAKIVPQSLNPGETAELDFKVALGTARGRLAKHITVRSN